MLHSSWNILNGRIGTRYENVALEANKRPNNSAPFIETKARFPLMFSRAGLTAMLGTAVSGRSIIVLRCLHPAWTGHSPRNAAQSLQNNGGVKPNTRRFGPWRRCGPSETNEAALEDEWKRLNHIWRRRNWTSSCGRAQEKRLLFGSRSQTKRGNYIRLRLSK